MSSIPIKEKRERLKLARCEIEHALELIDEAIEDETSKSLRYCKIALKSSLSTIGKIGSKPKRKKGDVKNG